MQKIYKIKLYESENLLRYWGTCVDVDEYSDFPINFLIDLDEKGERVSYINFIKKVFIPNSIKEKLKNNKKEFIILDRLGAIYDVNNDIHYLFW